jgi:hypothetical protein
MVLVASWIGWSGCASQGSARRGPSSSTRESGIVDLASEFLSTACHAVSATEFSNAWLAYEDRHRELYNALYYGSADSGAERQRLADELGPRRDEVCGHVRSFLIAAPGVIDHLRGPVTDLVGAPPRAPIYFTVALQRTDGRTDTFRNQEVLALNASIDTLARTSGLAATVAHELIHDAQTVAVSTSITMSSGAICPNMRRSR